LKELAQKLCGGTLTVKKSLSPISDPGLFDLSIDSNTFAKNVGDKGTTGAQAVAAGTHVVSEAAGSDSPTTLTDYSTQLVCSDKAGAVPVDATGHVKVDGNQDVTCTFSNSRKTGSLTVVKSLSPSSDPGLFDLSIDKTVFATGVGDKGSTGAQTVTMGDHTVAEASNASSPTSLADYKTTLACSDKDGVVKVSDAGVLSVGDGQQVTCTFRTLVRLGR
jgi:hypothetical protein